MVLKLHGNLRATCTQRVIIVLYEKAVDFEIVTVDHSINEHKSPEFKKFQPFGQSPYLDDDGFILYESRAISYYIAAKYANQGTQGLVPDSTDLKATALYLQAASVENNDFNGNAQEAFLEKVYKPIIGLTPDEEKFNTLMGKISQSFEAYEAILSKQKYLAGDQLTVADLFHLPLGYPLSQVSDVFTKYPNVYRWWKDLVGRPSFHKLLDSLKAQ